MTVPGAATATVLFTMEQLRSAGSWCGETHVQKAVYLCQELAGVPHNFRFVLYKHGPYSFGLSECLQSWVADDLVEVSSRPPYGPMLAVSEQGKKLCQSVRSGDDSLSTRITAVAKKLGGKGVADLERIATAVFVNQKYGRDLPLQKRSELLNSLKPHVQVEAAREAFTEADAIEASLVSVA